MTIGQTQASGVLLFILKPENVLFTLSMCMLDNLMNNFKVFVTGCLREFETGYPRSVRAVD